MVVSLFDRIVFSVTMPKREEIDRLIACQEVLPFSYPEVGASRDLNPRQPNGLDPAYRINHYRFRLGHGEAAYRRAREAFQHWQMFRLGWVRLCWPDTPLKPGATVAILGHVKKIWFLNISRIIYLIEEEAAEREVHRYGFGAGTLPGHAVRGEERFLVEWDRREGGVWYEILSFSQESHPIVGVVGELRAAQTRFARESGGTMIRFMRQGRIQPWA